MTLPLLIGLGIVIGGWSFLSVLGNERQRKVQELDVEAKATPSQPAVGDQVAR